MFSDLSYESLGRARFCCASAYLGLASPLVLRYFHRGVPLVNRRFFRTCHPVHPYGHVPNTCLVTVGYHPPLGGPPPMLCTVPGPPVSPRPGAPSVPPSRADPGPPAGRTSKVKNVFRFKIDAKSVPEALATTILILQKFSIDLAHRQNPGASDHPAPSDTPHPHPIGPPSAPIGTPFTP